MLSNKMEEALNAQINAEFWSAYLYLSMSAWCAREGKPGMAHWFEVQFQEEQDHARILFNLYALTHQENDYATQSMLKWFVDEQVEEEENATNIIDNLKMLNGNGYGIFMMDKDLAARVYTQAAPLAGKA